RGERGSHLRHDRGRPARGAMSLRVLNAVAGGLWREQRGRLVLATLGIALGVALGVAVHAINASAADAFSIAIRSLAGEADVIVRGPRGGFAETLYPKVARMQGVRA